MISNSFYLNLINIYVSCYINYSLFLTPVSSEEIIKVLNDFKPNKSRYH